MLRWREKSALICFLLALPTTLLGVEPETIRTEGRACLLRVEGQPVLRVEGSPYEMGRQHGVLLREEIRALVQRVLLLANSAGSDEATFFGGDIRRAWQTCAPHINARFQEELRGLADGAGLPLEDAQLANIFPELFHCSGFALFGKATRDGRLLHGRILDYMTYAGLQKFAVNIVAIPDGGVPFLNVGFAGFIGSVTGMNARQIAIGEMGGRGEGQWDGVPMAFLVRTALERAGTLDEALVVFRDAPRTCEYYYVVSDAKLPDARGLYCTPKTFGTVAPGERHERLPTPIADAVLLSADERYRYLVERVQDGYGKFGPAEALKMMERPVAMDSNLHCVLFDAAQSDAYVAIAADPGTERYQACFQPYARINLRAIIDFRPATETPSPLQGEGRGEGPAERDSASAPSVPTPGPEHAEGVISAAQVRPMKPTDDPALAELLKQFEPPPGEFAWSMDRQISSNTYDVYDLRFPSPVTTDTPENNTVCCEYFCCRGDQQRPAVIVLHILDGKFRESRLVCNALAARGIDAVLLKMAYYGPRRPKEPERARRLMQDLPTLIDGARQSAMDARRLAGWLQAQPQVDAQRIGILGISLGGFVAALTSGVDGGFWRSAFILSGGNLEQILRSPAREVRSVRDAIQAAGLTIDDVAARIALIEPCRYAGRIDCRTVLLINTESDPIIPRENVQALADAIGGVDIQWYPGDHYALLWHVLDILGRVEDHFAKP